MEPAPYKCEHCHELPMEFFHKGRMICNACYFAERSEEELDQFKVLDLDDPDYLV